MKLTRRSQSVRLPKSPTTFWSKSALKCGKGGSRECSTVVLHRHFPAVRETPDFKGLLRCRVTVAERESVASCRHATSRTATSASYMVDLKRLSTTLDAQERSGKITVKT